MAHQDGALSVHRSASHLHKAVYSDRGFSFPRCSLQVQGHPEQTCHQMKKLYYKADTEEYPFQADTPTLNGVTHGDVGSGALLAREPVCKPEPQVCMVLAWPPRQQTTGADGARRHPLSTWEEPTTQIPPPTPGQAGRRVKEENEGGFSPSTQR